MTPSRAPWSRTSRASARLLCVGGVVWLLCGSATAVRAGTPIPYTGEFRAQIEVAFFEPDPALDAEPGAMRVSSAKVAAYRDFLERKLRFLSAHVAQYEQLERGRSAEKAASRAEGTDTALALRVALSRLDRLAASDDVAAAYPLAADVLMLDFSTRAFTDPLSSVKIPKHLVGLLVERSLPGSTRLRGVDREAGNLVNPADGSFYTRDELETLVRGGSDLSEVDPPHATPFWREKPDIGAVDVVSNYLEGGDPVHEGLVADFPAADGAVFELDRLRLTQTKPKFDVIRVDAACLEAPEPLRTRCRRRMKLKFGSELNADPVANSLLATLGYNVDISMHLRNVKVYLGDHDVDDVERMWSSYFDRQRLHLYFPLHEMLVPGEEGRGRDERGEYLLFREAVAEVKAAEIERIGFFSLSEGIASNNREARALAIFNVWIANADLKDHENNKLSLRRDADGEWQIYLIQQDLGHAFGYVLSEKIEAYPWEVVDPHPISRLLGRLRGRIELDYINLQQSGFDHTVTHADAKWMVRRIAQLTRGQIETAVGLGSWPDSVARLLVEKLVNRRNDMVREFGLGDAYAMLPVDRALTTADGAVVDGELLQGEWEDTHVRYGHHWADTFGPVGRLFLESGMWALQRMAASIDRIDPGRINFGGRLVMSPEILLEIDREVLINPEPEGGYDQYIVRDTVGLGTNVAVGFFGSAEGTWMQRFSLAYPASTRREALLGGNRVLPLLLPLDVRRGELPDRYVLMRETGFAGGVRLSSDDTGELWDTLGGVLSFNRGTHFRSIVDRRGPDPVVWVDQPKFWRAHARAFIKAAIIEIPFAWGEISLGEIDGTAWRLDAERLGVLADDGTPAFERLVRFNDPSGLPTLGSRDPIDVHSTFESRNLEWTLYLVGADHERRDEEIVRRDPDGGVLSVELQNERRRVSRWQFLDNGERQGLSVTGYNAGDRPETIRPEGASVVARYSVEDLNAHNEEFDGYYDFLAGLGALDRTLARDFDAADWELTGEPDGGWTHLLTDAGVRYDADALDRLLKLDRAGFWALLAEELGLSTRVLLRKVDDMRRRDLRLGRRGARLSRGREALAIVRALSVLRLLDAARGADDEAERLGLLVAAIDRANFRSGHTFDPVVVAALHRSIGLDGLVDTGAVHVTGRIGRALDTENNLPERRAVVGRRGEPEELSEIRYRFFPSSAIDLYTSLDWLRSPNGASQPGR